MSIPSIRRTPVRYSASPCLPPIHPKEYYKCGSCPPIAASPCPNNSNILTTNSRMRTGVGEELFPQRLYNLSGQLCSRVHRPWSTSLVRLYFHVSLPRAIPNHQTGNSLNRQSESIRLLREDRLPASCPDGCICCGFLQNHPVCGPSLSGFPFALYRVSTRRATFLWPM